MKCLDTDLLIAILRGKEEAEQRIKQLDEEGKISTTSINAFEIFFGANRSNKAETNIKEASRLLGRLIVFPLDTACSQKAAEISAKLANKGEAIDYRDIMIAAICMQNNLTLITHNYFHFKRIKELKIQEW